MIKRIIFISCLSMFLLCGCAGPWVARNSQEHMTVDDVVVMDKSLRSWRPFTDVFGASVTVDRKKGTTKDDGRLHLQVELKNNRGDDLHFQIQTIFKDAQGFMLSDQSNWEHVIIPRQSSYRYSCTSMSKLAKHYLVRVRRSIN